MALVVSTQHNAWIHLVATVLATGMGVFLRIDRIEWCLITIAIGLVWTAEASNTALEFLADEVSQEHRAGIGKAKDLAAGAVLISAVAALVIGCVVFGPYLFHVWKSCCNPRLSH